METEHNYEADGFPAGWVLDTRHACRDENGNRCEERLIVNEDGRAVWQPYKVCADGSAQPRTNG